MKRHAPTPQFVVPLEQQVRQRLQPGEDVLWRGQPDEAAYAWRGARWFPIVLALLVTPTLWWLWQVPLGSRLLAGLTPLIMFATLGYVVYQSYGRARQEARGMRYWITSQRLLIHRWQTTQERWAIEEASLSSLRFRLREHGRLGTVTIQSRQAGFPRALSDLPDARDAYRVLLAVQGPPSAEPPRLPDAPMELSDAWLRPGEAVLWEGGPDSIIMRRTAYRDALILFLVASGLEAGLVYMLLTGQVPLFQHTEAMGAAVGLPFALPVLCFVMIKQAQDKRYVLTNRRAVQITRAGRDTHKLEERELWQVPEPTLKRDGNGTAKIVFERRVKWVWTGQSAHQEVREFAFTYLRDGETVLKVAREARRQCLQAQAGRIRT